MLVIAFFVGACITGLIVALLMVGVGNFKLVSKNTYSKMSEFYEDYSDLYAVDKAIDMYYYKDTKNVDREDTVCKALVNALGDKYSSYMTKKELSSFEAQTLGSYSGVGITFAADKDGNFVVVSIAEDSPASDSGIKTGDILLKANGKTYDDTTSFAEAIRGKKGTKVKIQYSHDGKKKTVTLTRDKINTKSVSYKVLDGDVGYIKISQFVKATYKDFKKSVEKLQDKECKKIVLDLRDNGGGLVNPSLKIADLFIDSGLLTYTVDKQGNKQEYKADDSKLNMDLVVLVNGNSASASEILTGALKDNGYKIVGEKTFGKGIIQDTMQLNSGSAVELTVAQYFTPKGNKVHKKGITPNYVIKNSGSNDSQLNKAKSLLEK